MTGMTGCDEFPLYPSLWVHIRVIGGNQSQPVITTHENTGRRVSSFAGRPCLTLRKQAKRYAQGQSLQPLNAPSCKCPRSELSLACDKSVRSRSLPDAEGDCARCGKPTAA
jgi:hypothetical protein